MSGYKRISVAEAELLLSEHDNVMLLDMRDALTYCQNHDPRAIHLSDLNLRTMLKSTPRDMHLVICCYHGHASQDMAALFAEFDFDNIYSLDGGYAAWQARPGQRYRTPAERIPASIYH
ncbi:thiosulfate sulfurtransferase GlpE [Stutzerimonas tarimensis]|uniref:Thiosulfate sulfurtransferase GlpE n=1 Tax=Stutzerimonas tarimensis TaxID=1507735 RepID=A0ABV7T741_9GAMM